MATDEPMLGATGGMHGTPDLGRKRGDGVLRGTDPTRYPWVVRRRWPNFATTAASRRTRATHRPPFTEHLPRPRRRAPNEPVTPDAAELSEKFAGLARLLQRVRTYEGLSTDGVVGGEH